MKVIHLLDGYSAEYYSPEVPPFILTNKKGGFYLEGIKSRYAGFFIADDDGKIFKIIDEIKTNSRTKELKNKFFEIEKKKATFSESIFLPFNTNSIVYETTNHNEIELLLDVKEIFDNRQWGRIYEVIPTPEGYVIKFTKKTDSREDKVNGQTEYDVYIAVKGTHLKAKLTKEWIKKDNMYDKLRGSEPFERYVFSALKLKSSAIVLSASFSKEKAVKEANYVLKNLKKLKQKQEEYFKNLINNSIVKEIKNNNLKIAYICALSSLYSNIIKTKDNIGIYAGIPWFTQFWTRDELVSLKSLILNKDIKISKKIILKNLNNIQDEGRLVNISAKNPKKTNADSIAWLFKRIDDLGIEKFSKKEQRLIKEKLTYSIEKIKTNYFKEGFLYNNPLETWMDTEWGNDNREGCCIEIQAMFLFMLEFAYKLTKNPIYNIEKAELLKKVRDNFFVDSYLYDKLKDSTIRPNIFIAYYFYPELLTRHEWIRCIKIVAPELWLEWGGFSTIGKSNPLFCNEYSGEQPRSYHRGDSWFWLNFLAAMCMYDLNKISFKKYIDAILKTTKNIVSSGTLPHFPELSSASKLEMQGSPSQTWSAAMFIELIHKIY